MPPEVHFPDPIPLKNRFLGTPDQGEQFEVNFFLQSPLLQEVIIILVEKMFLFRVEELMGNGRDAGRYPFDIHSYPVAAADDGGGKLTGVRNGKMIFLALKKGLAGVGDQDLFQRKVRKEIRQ